MPTYHDRVPVMVMAVSDVPRPTGRIPGLAHTYALGRGSGELVECFMYPGDGQVIIPGGSVSMCQSMLLCDLAVIRGSGGGSSMVVPPIDIHW
jgi:hypothetical protein